MKKFNFAGFTLPDGAWLPPELLYLLPYFSSLSQLKVTIVAIYHYMQVGGCEPLSLTDFERLTGLSHQSVVGAVQWLTGENDKGLQVLEREQVGRSFVYHPRLRLLGKSLTSRLIDPESEPDSLTSRLSDGAKSLDSRLIEGDDSLTSRLIDPENDAESLTSRLITSKNDAKSLTSRLSDPENDSLKLKLKLDKLKLEEKSSTPLAELKLDERVSLISELRAAGVYLKVAQGLVDQHPVEHIREKMDYFRYAMSAGYAESSGWLVSAIKENFPPPLGYRALPGSSSFQDEDLPQPVEDDQVEGQEDDLPRSAVEYQGPAVARRAWEAARTELQREMPQAAFDRWVADAQLASYEPEGQRFTVGVPTEMALAWWVERLTSRMQRFLVGAMGCSVDLDFVVIGGNHG